MINRNQARDVISEDVQHIRLFDLANDRRLSLGQDYDVALAQRKLSHLVARYPHDLRVHCQRILLSVENEDRMVLPGYLQDLFIVLGDSGKALRSSMVDISKPLLNAQRRQSFAQWLKSGDSFAHKYTWTKGSVLSSDVAGEPLVQREVIAPIVSETCGTSSDILEEARSYLEYGQIEEARDLLEQSIMNEPDNAEFEDELLNIYFYTRDASALTMMGNKITEKGGTLSEAWYTMQEISTTWES